MIFSVVLCESAILNHFANVNLQFLCASFPTIKKRLCLRSLLSGTVLALDKRGII